MRKSAPLAFAIAGGLILGGLGLLAPVAAMSAPVRAGDSDSSSESSETLELQDTTVIEDESNIPHGEKKRKQLEDKYGKQYQLTVPPVVVKPLGDKTGSDAILVNPVKNNPIDISEARFNRRTPAEMFIQAAQIGLAAMALGAVALGVFTASRAIRRK